MKQLSIFADDYNDPPIWQATPGSAVYHCAACDIIRYCRECGARYAASLGMPAPAAPKGMNHFTSCNEHRETAQSLRIIQESGAALDYHERCHLAGIGGVDLITTDVPWNYDSGVTHAKQTELVQYETISDFREMFRVFHATLKQDRNCWIFTDWFNQCRIIEAASACGFTYRGFVVVRRQRLGMGQIIRKRVYLVLLFTKGKAVYPKGGPDYIDEFLGTFDCVRSHKPAEIYAKLRAHSLTGIIDGVELDPFPASHIEVKRKPRAARGKAAA